MEDEEERGFQTTDVLLEKYQLHRSKNNAYAYWLQSASDTRVPSEAARRQSADSYSIRVPGRSTYWLQQCSVQP